MRNAGKGDWEHLRERIEAGDERAWSELRQQALAGHPAAITILYAGLAEVANNLAFLSILGPNIEKKHGRQKIHETIALAMSGAGPRYEILVEALERAVAEGRAKNLCARELADELLSPSGLGGALYITAEWGNPDAKNLKRRLFAVRDCLSAEEAGVGGAQKEGEQPATAKVQTREKHAEMRSAIPQMRPRLPCTCLPIPFLVGIVAGSIAGGRWGWLAGVGIGILVVPLVMYAIHLFALYTGGYRYD